MLSTLQEKRGAGKHSACADKPAPEAGSEAGGRACAMGTSEVAPCEMHEVAARWQGRLGVHRTQLEPEVLKNELRRPSESRRERSCFCLCLSLSLMFVGLQHIHSHTSSPPCKLSRWLSAPSLSALVTSRAAGGGTDIAASCPPQRVCPWEALDRNEKPAGLRRGPCFSVAKEEPGGQCV